MNKLRYREVKSLSQEHSDKECRARYQSLCPSLLYSVTFFFFGVDLMALHQDLLLLLLPLSRAKIIFYWLVSIIYQPLHTGFLCMIGWQKLSQENYQTKRVPGIIISARCTVSRLKNAS